MTAIIDKQVDNTKQAVKPPSICNVIFVNDDFTTFEFVMSCLIQIFGKTEEQSFVITDQIHVQGRGIVGQYTRDIALTKQQMVLDYAKSMEFPLQVVVESI